MKKSILFITALAICGVHTMHGGQIEAINSSNYPVKITRMENERIKVLADLPSNGSKKAFGVPKKLILTITATVDNQPIERIVQLDDKKYDEGMFTWDITVKGDKISYKEKKKKASKEETPKTTMFDRTYGAGAQQPQR